MSRRQDRSGSNKSTSSEWKQPHLHDRSPDWHGGDTYEPSAEAAWRALDNQSTSGNQRNGAARPGTQSWPAYSRQHPNDPWSFAQAADACSEPSTAVSVGKRAEDAVRHAQEGNTDAALNGALSVLQAISAEVVGGSQRAHDDMARHCEEKNAEIESLKTRLWELEMERVARWAGLVVDAGPAHLLPCEGARVRRE